MLKEKVYIWVLTSGLTFCRLYQGDISPSPRTTPTPTKTPEQEYVQPVTIPKRKQKLEPKVEPSSEPKFEETESEHFFEPEEEEEQQSYEVPEFIKKQNTWKAPFESDQVIKARKEVKRWLFALVRKFVQDKGT